MGVIKNIFEGIRGIFSGKKKPAGKVAEAQAKKTFEEKQDKVQEKRPEEKAMPPKSPGEKKKALEQVQREAKKFALEQEVKKYRKTIKALRGDVEKLKKRVDEKEIKPKQALGGVQVIYNEIKSENRNIDKEMKQAQNLMDYLEQDFLKHRISEQMFRQKMFDYREKLHILELEKKELSEQKKDLRDTTKKIPDVIPATLDQIARTENLEKLLAKQQETLEKIASQRPTIIFSSGKKMSAKERAQLLKTGLAAAPDSAKISAFLEQKAKGKLNPEKLSEVEGKIGEVMRKYGISETEIEQRLGGTSTDNLVDSITRLVNLIELERQTNSKMMKSERIETAMRFTQPMKEVEEVKGIATEIKKHRIVTDFDRVLMYILQNGKAKVGKIVKDLGIPRQRVEECCRLLHDEKQVEIVYPPIGDAVVQTLDYRQKLEIQKAQKKGKVA